MREGLARLACAITRLAYASRHDALAANLAVEAGRDIVECHILRACAKELGAIALVGASLVEGQGGKTPTYLRQELIEFVHALLSITFLLSLSSIVFSEYGCQ